MSMLDLMNVSRRRASTLPWRRIPVVRLQLQHPRPTIDMCVPSSPPYALEDTCFIPPDETVSEEDVVLKQHSERAVHAILVLVKYKQH
jgi:hypothetical protein